MDLPAQELKLKMNANLSVAINHLEGDTPEEHLQMIKFCLYAAKECADSLSNIIGNSDPIELKSEISKLKKEITEKTERVNSLQDIEIDSNNKLNELNQALNRKDSDLKISREEASELASKNTELTSSLEVMDQRLITNSKEVKTLRKNAQSMSGNASALEKAKKKIGHQEKTLTAKTETIKSQKASSERLKEQIKSLKNPDATEVEVDGVTYFISVIEAPFFSKLRKGGGISYLDGLSWHVRVLSSDGIAVFPTASRWLTAILPECQEFQDKWSVEVNDAIHNSMMSRAKKDEYLTNFVSATQSAKSIMIKDCEGLSDNEIKWLTASGVLTIFDALSKTLTLLKRTIRTEYPEDKATDEDISELYVKLTALSRNL
ncbi:hypothetical protein VCHA53O466_50373 [Vibrio chagasii]|nr:hypothetical protein VCHA53O466_50373 [Vibrio chagasii]